MIDINECVHQTLYEISSVTQPVSVASGPTRAEMFIIGTFNTDYGGSGKVAGGDWGYGEWAV